MDAVRNTPEHFRTQRIKSVKQAITRTSEKWNNQPPGILILQLQTCKA